VLDSLTQSRDERERSLAVQADLEGRLVECGGITGQGIESHWLSFHSVKDQDHSHHRTKRARSSYKFRKVCPDLDSPTVEEPFWFTEDREAFRVYETEDEWSVEGFRHKFHQLLYGEVETTDRMGKMIADFPDLPWGMRMDLAHQMWDEARHIEIVAKAVEEELGGELGYGPWPYVWWWMQNEDDPLRRITVTNCWAEANLMKTLKEWQTKATERGLFRIAELCDYLQADEYTHVKDGTEWVRKLTDDDPKRRDDLVEWGRAAVDRIEGFYEEKPPPERHVRFTFKGGGGGELVASESNVVGE
jgi:hypothetical protein